MRATSVWLAGVLLAATAGASRADSSGVSDALPASLSDGGQIYQHVCQGCHMSNARGGRGAASIPALAGDQKLLTSGYPVVVVLNGLGGMPWFSNRMNDEQIAAVINYVRTHFGNDWHDAVAPADVASVRGPAIKEQE